MSLGSVRVAIWLLAIIAVMTVLDIASALFAPVVMALVLGVVLSPLARRIDRLGVPNAAGAFLTLMLMLAVIAGLFVLVEPVVSSIIARAPVIWSELSATIAELQSTMRGIDRMSEQVSEALGDSAAGSAGSAMPVPTVSDAIVLAPGLAAWVMIFVGTLYFFLLSRREVYAFVARSQMGPSAADLLEAEREVSRYFLTIAVINAGFGLVVAAIFWFVGIPYPILWGGIVFLANFILYLGPALVVVALVVAGAVFFDGAMTFVPALIFLGCNVLEAQFVTPSLIGRQMAVNPLLVFLSLVFWLWLWGPVGGIVAIPLLVWGLAVLSRRPARAAEPAADVEGPETASTPAQ